MITFNSIADCIESQDSLDAKIATIDTIIDTLMTSVLKAVEKGSIQDYSLNDGQTVIRTVYRNPNDVIKSIELLERIKNTYISRKTGRAFRLIHGGNFMNK